MRVLYFYLLHDDFLEIIYTIIDWYVGDKHIYFFRILQKSRVFYSEFLTSPVDIWAQMVQAVTRLVGSPILRSCIIHILINHCNVLLWGGLVLIIPRAIYFTENNHLLALYVYRTKETVLQSNGTCKRWYYS